MALQLEILAHRHQLGGLQKRPKLTAADPARSDLKMRYSRTTIAILMCAIRDSLGADDQIQKRRIQRFYLTNEDYADTEFFKLLPTQGDREAYFPLIRGEGVAPNSQFKEAYEFFKRRLRDDTDSGEKIDPRRILEIIETCLMVVMINLSDSDDCRSRKPHLEV